MTKPPDPDITLPTHPAANPPTALPSKTSPRRKPSFLIEYLRTPARVGALAPSGTALANAMLHGIDFPSASCIVEYGPGTGAFTRHILPRLAPATRFVAIELSDSFVATLRTNFPTLNLHHASVTDVAAALASIGVAPTGSVDAIVSGLPWASFPASLQTAILDATLPVLKPGGKLITFGYAVSAYLPAAKRFSRQLLPRYFAKIDKSPTVWLNFPPAFVLTCTKAR